MNQYSVIADFENHSVIMTIILLFLILLVPMIIRICSNYSLTTNSDYHQRKIQKYNSQLNICHLFATLIVESFGESKNKNNLSGQELIYYIANINRHIKTLDNYVDNFHRYYTNISEKGIIISRSSHGYSCLTLVWEIYKLRKLINREDSFEYMNNSLTKFFKMLGTIPCAAMYPKFFNEGRKYPTQFDVFLKDELFFFKNKKKR
jgi:hypothetical protein